MNGPESKVRSQQKPARHLSAIASSTNSGHYHSGYAEHTPQCIASTGGNCHLRKAYQPQADARRHLGNTLADQAVSPCMQALLASQ